MSHWGDGRGEVNDILYLSCSSRVSAEYFMLIINCGIQDSGPAAP